MNKRFGKVAVLMGGASGEREVSLNSGKGVLEALRSQGVDAHAFDPANEALDVLKAYDRAFIVLHGGYGENGAIQGALEIMGIPHTGPGVMASAIGMDKFRTKLIWQASGLPVPEYVMLDEASDFAAVEKQLGLPLFVKPACEGSSIGVVMVTQPGALHAAYQTARQHDALVMAEKGVMGGEYTVAILGDEVLPIIKIEPKTGFYDYEAKYLRDDTRYICPADLPAAKVAEIRAGALRAFRVLGATGCGRVDFLLDEAGRHYFLEINTAPGMTTHSLMPMAARARGLAFADLCVQILEGARLG
ncbi:D-alanine--D-alanine ligase [Betaproteobacteria bacterium]|nr:D-alanine--D-alanine ligase [Betaproteobacteria bacterium]GHU00748.1 D-alanine--D-alanine ligase [Betaproteobacteria bacterium]GHU17600.1 D-alanine--D-alanine ligase [Betaproteobacteria bacterium]